MKKTNLLAILFTFIGFIITGCSSTSPSLVPPSILTSTPTALPPTPEVEVVYYDISGFLVRIGDKKILIDTLSDGFPGHAPPQKAFGRMLAGEPPFDQVNLVLTTHTDIDHFSAAVMSTFLKNNPETVLVSTFQVVEELAEAGVDLVNPIYSVDIQRGESEIIILEGIEIECLYISHGDPNLLNLGFIVTVDQVSFFHSGDLVVRDVSVEDLLAYHLPDRHLDFAFVVFHLLKDKAYNELITEGIQAKYVIPMHYPYDDPLKPIEAFPNAIFFSDTMQTWQMP